MYDIEFFVPITTEGHWKKRFKEAKDILLLNVRDRKVRITLLTGPHESEEEEDEIKHGWNESIDVEVIQTPFNSASQKIMFYYTKIVPKKLGQTKWFCRMDDDSLTDVDRMVSILDEEYDYESPQHIAGHLKCDIHPIEQNLMTRLGYGHLYVRHLHHHLDLAPVHDHEIGITSSPCMEVVLGNPTSLKLLTMRGTIHGGFGDHCFALAAKIAGVLPSLCRAFTTENEWTMFSLLLGGYAHVHSVCVDSMHTEKWDIMKNVLLGELQEDIPGSFEVIKFVQDVEISVGFLEFEKNGHITDLERHIIGRWSARNDRLHVFVENDNGPLPSVELRLHKDEWKNNFLKIKSQK